MRSSRFITLAAMALSLVSASGQTYTPRQIRLQGIGASEQPELLRLLALKPGAPVTKTEIEAALQRLVDTGSFADLSYTVDSNALTFILKPVEGNQALPVRFSNFVWWQPGELEPLVKARVPLFHGKLPLTGQLTSQVSAALVALLAEKGIPNAKITVGTSTLGPSSSNGISSIVLAVAQPPVTIGEIKLTGASPAVEQQLLVVTSRLAGQDFDLVETSAAIRNNVADTHLNSGFLDVIVDPPVFSLPHKEMFGFAVDAAATVHPGALYRIGTLDLNPAPPVTHAEAEQATELHIGDPAGAMALKIAEGQLQRTYEAHGHLEAHVQAFSTRNVADHTTTYRFSIDPGALDHLAGISTSALSPELQAAFAREWHGSSGMPAGAPLNTELLRTLKAIHAVNSVLINQRLDRREHTLTLALLPKTTSVSP